MEFLTPKQKRDKSRRLFLGYGLFGILIVLATYVMVSTALGYEVFSTKGEIVQNGLLFVDSKPDAAIININGTQESSKTNAKLSLPEGSYNIALNKPGYREWKSVTNLSGGSVEFLTYPRLLPDTLEELSTVNYAGSSMKSLQSRDKRWVALYTAAEPSLMRIHDINRPQADVLNISIPSYTSGNVELIEWAGDNTHFLVSVESNSVYTYLVFNREEAEDVVNVSTLFGVANAPKVAFWDGKWDEVTIVDTGGVVRIGSIKNKSLAASSLVSDKVEDFFTLSNERAVYTTLSIDGTKSVRILDDAVTYPVLNVPDPSKAIFISGGGYNRNDYLLISGAGLEKALLYRNIVQTIKQSNTGRVSPFVTMPITGDVAEFSRSNRFVLVASNSEHAVYDVEQKELFRYKTPVGDTGFTGWFDDARIYSVTTKNELHIYDFNGANDYIVASNVLTPPMVNTDVETVSLVLQKENSIAHSILDIANSQTE